MISHIEAQALISARLDGPLDPVAERELQAHIATCPACRAFAGQTATMTRAFHNLPYLPASPTVSRAVMEHVQRPRTLWGRGQEWLTPNLGSALATLAALVVIAALGAFVLTRVIDSGGDRNSNTRVLTAPSQESGGGVAFNGSTPTPSPTRSGSSAENNVPTAVPTAVPTLDPVSTSTDAVEPAVPDPTSTAIAAPTLPDRPTAPAGRDRGGDSRQVVDKTAAAATTESHAVTPAPTAGTSRSGTKAPADGGTQAAALQGDGRPTPTPLPTWTPTATATAEPTSTPQSTLEPTSTPMPTLEPTTTPELTSTPPPTLEPTQEPTATDEPTSEPTATPEPTSTPQPTEVPTQPVTLMPTSTENPQVIEPATGSVEGGDAFPTSVVPDAPTLEAPSAPSPVDNQPTAANGGDNSGDGTNPQIIEPSTGDAASPQTSDSPDSFPTNEAGGQVPATEVPATEDSGQVISPPNGSDAQGGGQDQTPTETVSSNDATGEQRQPAPTSDVAVVQGDLASATVLGPSPGAPGDRLEDQNESAGGSSAQSAGGATLSEQPGQDGTSVFVCLAAGCIDATSASAVGPHQDTAVGWVNGTTMIYQREQDGSYEYRAADVDTAGGVMNDRSLGSGDSELGRSGSVFPFQDGLLVETNGGWVLATADAIVPHPSGSSSASRTLVRVYPDLNKVAFVSGGELFVQDLGSDMSTRIPFTGVDYDLSPQGDRVVVSTGTGIEIIDLGGTVVATLPNAQGMAIGSVLWMPDDTIEFVDQATGEIRSIGVP